MFVLRAHADFRSALLRLPRLRTPCLALRGSLSFGFRPSSTYRGVVLLRVMLSPPVVVKDKIELTESEQKIFQHLLDVTRHYGLKTQLRVAGGWVRDKLLGKDCYDIDIALDNMMGKEFCEKVKDYLGNGGSQSYCVIQSNPDQSKHLETARMKVFDTIIDFVNLRSEKYIENSRIPSEMDFGTPKEDAERRDLTINSLFYNINTDSIEDFTGRGIEDLKSGRIVTPLPPKNTFTDDPLRVLRAIRFGARFGFTLDEELKIAAADEEVRVALQKKISRERIGHEVDLMVGGNRPVPAITWIHELQLFQAVFTPPDGAEPPIAEDSSKDSVVSMETAWNALELIGHSAFSNEERRLCLYAALLFPFSESVYPDKKLKKIPVSSHIIKNSLKLKNSDAETILNLHDASERFVHLIRSLESDHESVQIDVDDECLEITMNSRKRILAGLILRKIKDYWRVALLISTFLNRETGQVESFFVNRCGLESKAATFKNIESKIYDLKLDEVWQMKPLLDGNSLMGILQIKGRQIGEWQQRLLKWQLAHPEGTTEDCLEWLKQSHAKRVKLN